jgi:OHCU decarboxylase
MDKFGKPRVFRAGNEPQGIIENKFSNWLPTTRSRFLDVFVGVYEKTPWIAESVWPEHFENVEKLWDVTDAKSVDNLLLAMRKSVDISEKEKKLALLKSHPDLAGKLAISTFKEGITDDKSEKALTSHSQQEQKSAGLDKCSPEEFKKFQSNNKTYLEKFGFPYILAVSGRSRTEILENFTQRVKNEVDAEFSEAIEQVHRIAKIRVEKIVGEFKKNFTRM